MMEGEMGRETHHIAHLGQVSLLVCDAEHEGVAHLARAGVHAQLPLVR